ncbi:unnamed protein product [Paramecium primaurelia]|uniref:Uncharacterized protein n=1 Tax=Paramecium primaurelia TaxID=5886 RepID=A0A8S1K216_PARPR|nr:unnamed protein product [Paramecium primaurelia]
MKSKSSIKIKKKIKKIIQIIIIEEYELSSPHNTNQYLLTKHEQQKTNLEKDCQPPGSMLQFLLGQDKNIQSPLDVKFFPQIQKALKIT